MKWASVVLALLFSGYDRTDTELRTFLVSVDSTGAQADGWSDEPAISADGRHVAFVSAADNLVANDTNGAPDVFVLDRVIGLTRLVSTSSEGVIGNDFSHAPSISADGRFVAFSSRADNLVPGDSNEQEDVFVRDLATGATELVSAGPRGEGADSYSSRPAISPDGRHVAFESRASNLVAGDTNDEVHVFVRNLELKETRRVGEGERPAVSGGGRFIVFDSMSATLVAGDGNGSRDVFRHDAATGMTERVSVAASGVEANDDSFSPAMTPDGRRVVFESFADNLHPGDSNRLADIFLRDMLKGTTVRVSVGLDGGDASKSPSISRDGRIVAFRSATDLFVRNLDDGSMARISDGLAFALSADGRHVAFRSHSTRLIESDMNDASDIFVQNFEP